MQNQWAWLKSQAGERSSLVADLLDKLRQFNQQHGDLRAFVTSGQELLATEHPVGDSAARIEEQMETCQVCTNVHGVHVYSYSLFVEVTLQALFIYPPTVLLYELTFSCFFISGFPCQDHS